MEISVIVLNWIFKITGMKTKILGVVFLMSVSTLLMSQPTENVPTKEFQRHNREMRMKDGQKSGPFKSLNLTDAQKESFKQSRMAIQKQLQPIRNELGEIMAHQKSLTTADKPDIDAINRNIEKLGALRVEMAKIHVRNLLELRAQLTDEQRLKFDMIVGKMMKGRNSRGMMHNQAWGHEHADI